MSLAQVPAPPAASSGLKEPAPPEFLARWRTAALIVGLLFVGWWSTHLHLWMQGVVVLVLVTTLGIGLRLRGVNTFGPVLGFDMVRTARQARSFFFRALYAFALLVVLAYVYSAWVAARGGNLRVVLEGGIVSSKLAADFAGAFFQSVVWLQFIAVFALTPIYVAGAVADEKERGTLEYLLASDLEDQEIVLSKLVARLANVLCVLLAALPVLALTELLGGVDPQLVIGSFVLTILMTITLGSLSLLVSVYARRMIDALFWTYFWSGVLFFFSWWLALAIPALSRGLLGVGPSCLTLGNPLVLVHLIQDAYATSANQSALLVELLRDYAFWHIAYALCFATLAVRRLRVVALKPDAPPEGSHQPVRVEFPPRRRRKKLGAHPLLWKEVFGEALLGSPRLTAFIIYIQLVLGWVLIPVLCCGVADLGAQGAGWFRNIALLFGGVMLLTVAAYAAGAVTRERERQTLETLLSLPLDSDAILRAKWLGSVLSVRPMWWCFGIILVVGAVSTAQPLALPLVLLAWWAHAALFASLGLWFSLRTRSTMRATIWTVGAIFGAAVVCRLLGNFGAVFLAPYLGNDAARWWTSLWTCGLAPFGALDVGMTWRLDVQSVRDVLAAVAGTVVYAALAWLLLWVTCRTFCAQANRSPRRNTRAPAFPD